MCYQHCTKYECPSCGEEPIADRRSYVLCLRNSGCRWLYEAPETLPRQVIFESGPSCGSCREERERQHESARSTAENSGCRQAGAHQRQYYSHQQRQYQTHEQRQSPSHQKQHSHTHQRQQAHTHRRARSYSRHRLQSYGQFPERDTTADPRHQGYSPQQDDHYLMRTPEQRQREPEPERPEDPYLPEPKDDGIDYENYYRDHTCQSTLDLPQEVRQSSHQEQPGRYQPEEPRPYPPQEPGRYAPQEPRGYHHQEPRHHSHREPRRYPPQEQPNQYSPHQAYRTRRQSPPSSPPPLRRRHTESSRRPAAPRRQHDYQRRYRAPHRRSEATRAPSHSHHQATTCALTHHRASIPATLVPGGIATITGVTVGGLDGTDGEITSVQYAVWGVDSVVFVLERQ